MTAPYALLALQGQVPWEWLAACRDCGRPHDYVPDPSGKSYRTWSSPGCASYRPRMNRWLLDALMIEHRCLITELVTTDKDPWRLAEWNSLPDVCFIAGCDSSETDQRGPVWLRDGSIAKACTEHWEPIMSVLGEQAGSSGDTYRSPGPSDPM